MTVKDQLRELGESRREAGRRIMEHTLGHATCPACQRDSFLLIQDRNRLRTVNAKLLEALKSAAVYRHAAHGDSFQVCTVPSCEEARDAIEEATDD